MVSFTTVLYCSLSKFVWNAAAVFSFLLASSLSVESYQRLGLKLLQYCWSWYFYSLAVHSVFLSTS